MTLTKKEEKRRNFFLRDIFLEKNNLKLRLMEVYLFNLANNGIYKKTYSELAFNLNMYELEFLIKIHSGDNRWQWLSISHPAYGILSFVDPYSFMEF